jgi:hypothetical protein
MSEPSFQLSKRGATWWATFAVGQKTVKVECGDGSRKAAEKRAAEQQKRRLQLFHAAKQRWINAGVVPGTPTVPKVRPSAVQHRSAQGAPPLEEPDDEPTPIERPTPPPPPPRPDPPPLETPAPAPDLDRAAAIKAKLLALGDGRPIEPDSVHRPGEDIPDDDDPPMDNEAGELLADVIAGAVTTWHVKKIATVLKKRKPPRRPGEPNEKMLEWYRGGASYNLAKLVGKATTMGPTAKMFVGAALLTVGMLVESEEIDGAPAAAAPAAAAPAPAASSPDAATDDDDRSPPPTPIRPKQTNALGTFGK